jgi:hypothetical protein
MTLAPFSYSFHEQQKGNIDLKCEKKWPAKRWSDDYEEEGEWAGWMII